MPGRMPGKNARVYARKNVRLNVNIYTHTHIYIYAFKKYKYIQYVLPDGMTETMSE
jgi:hypothetical protein